MSQDMVIEMTLIEVVRKYVNLIYMAWQVDDNFMYTQEVHVNKPSN